MSELLNYTTEKVVADYDRLRVDCGALELPEVALVTMAGEDRKGWLQGQATNNLRSLDEGASSSFCLCTPTGMIQAVCDIWSTGGRFHLTMARASLPAFIERVEQMVIMEDVAAEASAKEYWLLSVQGPQATNALSEKIELPKLDASETMFNGTALLACRSNRTGFGGWDLWIPKSAPATFEQLRNAFPTIDPEAYEIARLESGIPKIGADINEKTLPPELGIAFESKHVSYHKGCYTGQEVLMRIHSRGHTNRTWMGLIAERPIRAGSTVSRAGRPDSGVVTSALFSPDYGHIGAAMLRNEAAFPGEIVQVLSEGSEVEAEVRPMPLLRLD